MKHVTPVLCLLGAFSVTPLFAQLGMFSTEQRTDITREWKGERFPDGRPKVPDEVINRLQHTTAEEAWARYGSTDTGCSLKATGKRLT